MAAEIARSAARVERYFNTSSCAIADALDASVDSRTSIAQATLARERMRCRSKITSAISLSF